MIFCSKSPLKKQEIKASLEEMFDAAVPEKDIDEAISSLKDKYDNEQYSLHISFAGGGYQFLTKPAYQASVGILLKQQSKKRLSNSALETLSIIAYKQPVTKSEMEQIRGVNCDYTVQKLLDKDLVEIKGKADSLGRPLLYGTSEFFMEYFGINDIKELPVPKDFASEDNSIGPPDDNENESGDEE